METGAILTVALNLFREENMKNKRILSILAVALTLIFVIAACGSSAKQETVESSAGTQTQEQTQASSEEEPAQEEAPMVGGWETVTDGYKHAISDEAREAFEGALEGYVGMNLDPQIVLATQVVSGTNYAFLCTGERVVKDPVTGWYIAVVYADLQGNCKFTSVEEIGIPDIETAETDDSADLVGAWSVTTDEIDQALPQDVNTAFEKASEKLLGVDYESLEVLATQLVSGTNYLILARGTSVTQDPVTSLYVMTMYVPLEGDPEFTDIQLFDMLAYIDN